MKIPFFSKLAYPTLKRMAIGWTIFIFILCSFPGKALPHFNWMDMLSFDKWVHAGIFFILGVLYLYLFKTQTNTKILRQNPRFFSFFFCFFYGLTLEYLQYKIFSQRSGDWGDVLANSSGALLSLFSKLPEDDL